MDDVTLFKENKKEDTDKTECKIKTISKIKYLFCLCMIIKKIYTSSITQLKYSNETSYGDVNVFKSRSTFYIIYFIVQNL